MEARVSNLELYRIWSGMENTGVDWIVNRLADNAPTEKMEKGTAFHKALELAAAGTDCYTLTAMGYTFHVLCDVEISLPSLRETRLVKDYEGLTISGTLDGLTGNTVTDYKTTEQFDGERYMESLQWRFYLDLSGADRFDYKVFQMKEKKEKEYEVTGYHTLSQFRYADLHSDCLKAARDYKRFADTFLQARPIQTELTGSLGAV